MTTTFIKFTEIRKNFIDFYRNRLMTERPSQTTHIYRWRGYEQHSVIRNQPLSLVDYAVYAALRGADYRKGDHTGGEKATKVLQNIVKHYQRGWLQGAAWTKMVPEGVTEADKAEFISIIESELARWETK